MTAPWQGSWLKSKDNPLLFVTDVLGATPDLGQVSSEEKQKRGQQCFKTSRAEKVCRQTCALSGLLQLRLAVKNERSPQKDQPVVSAA